MAFPLEWEMTEEKQEVFHIAVMAKEVVQYLNCAKGGVFVDLTIGEGGHAEEILKASPEVFLVGVDWDEEILRRARKRLKEFEGRFVLVRDNFVNVDAILQDLDLKEVDGILLDLGVSSFHLNSQRGFSFNDDVPLDMRMDKSNPLTADEIINRWPLEEVRRVIRFYGDEKWASKIVKAIGERRLKGGIKSARELAELIAQVIPKKFHPEKIHPATKTFLALRIAVNQELKNLKEVLEKLPFCLKKGGRIVVLSFHSLEHRIVKEVFGRLSKDCICPSWYPQCLCGGNRKVLELITRNPILPSEEEIKRNPRARSAQMRVAERI
jgi:16S rRNA (cytosine1402-N4)-methyltransferase